MLLCVHIFAIFSKRNINNKGKFIEEVKNYETGVAIDKIFEETCGYGECSKFSV